MSYILDSLKKSEQQRRDGTLPGLQSEPLGPLLPGKRRRSWLVGLLLAVLLGNAALLGWVLVGRAPEPSALPGMVPSPAPPPAPPAAAPEPSRPVAQSAPEPPLSGPGVVTPGSPATVGAVAQPGLQPVPWPAAVTPATRETTDLPAAGRMASEPADRLYRPDELPEELRRKVPSLQLSMHYYSGGGQGGLVRLNGRMLRPGDVFENGLVVEEIVPEGVVLAGQGFRVLVERP